MKINRRRSLILLTLLVLLAVVIFKQQSIRDWVSLEGYHAPADVSSLAIEDTMTAKAKRLFFVNKPNITRGITFTSQCPMGGEKTVVLGCYVGNDQGIYIYKVTDERLNGVERVTAAHEMLHAAYRRLTTSQRNKVDGMLDDYYRNGLTDERIKTTIDAYRKSEPNDVVNEMHSIFGTEVSKLPSPLEQYYKQYFNNRSVVTGYTAQYQSEFTKRKTQISSYDTQLSDLKGNIANNETRLTDLNTAIDSQMSRMTSEKANGQNAQYNADVVSYNSRVDSFNALLADTKQLVSQYNDIVNARNAVVLEEQQLVKELSASDVK